MTMLIALLLTGSVGAVEPAPAFSAARPVWPAGREKEMNLAIGFVTAFETPQNGRPVLRITASSAYRASLDGSGNRLAAYGPARGPHGWFRVDEWDLAGGVQPGQNVLVIEVVGYNVDNFYIPNQPAFLQAEVVVGDRVLRATGRPGDFQARVMTERVQRVQRYSQQRAFSEVYRLQPQSVSWTADPEILPDRVECTLQPTVKLLPRRVPYPDFALRQPERIIGDGRIQTGRPVKDEPGVLGFGRIGLHRGGYPVEQFEAFPIRDLAGTELIEARTAERDYSPDTPLVLKAGEYCILDFGVNRTGFPGFRISNAQACRLLITFDEILMGGDVNPRRAACANVIDYGFPATKDAGGSAGAGSSTGGRELESFEPYTFRYLKLIAMEGECRATGVHLREYANPDVWRADFLASDPRLNRLFAAARETYRQNVLDVFMDCPSRERAGWLCDSFFSARVAQRFSGGTVVERNFYENFLLPTSFKNLPEGMLPMCYPGDHLPDSFIPNWALWFVVELEEYLARSGDRELVMALQPKVLKLFDYFAPFRNESGLLEKLQGWVFIEWSKANDFVQDVNYPSNMVYAGALAAAGRMYAMPELIRQSEAIKEEIRRQAFDGEYFLDNAVRQDGKLAVTTNHTETCQYYAFFFDVATPERNPDLWKIVCEQFGPQRKQNHALPEVPLANAFIGNMLRLELLSRYGLTRQLLDEAIGYNLYMAEATGTLWENVDPGASCNHGFASHLAHTLYRDVLGLYRVDTVNRVLTLRVSDLPLEWCEGRVPVPEGAIEMRWWREQGTVRQQVNVPAGWQINTAGGPAR